MLCSLEANLFNVCCLYIFLFVAKVVLIIGEIHKTIYIIICVLWSEFYVGGYFTLLVHHLNSLCTKEAGKKGVSLSFLKIPLQNQGQGRCSAFWSLCILWPLIYIAVLLLFRNTFRYLYRFWTGTWNLFLLWLWIPACLRHQIEIWVIITRKIHFLISIFTNSFQFYHQWFYLWSSISSQWFR